MDFRYLLLVPFIFLFAYVIWRLFVYGAVLSYFQAKHLFKRIIKRKEVKDAKGQ